MPDEVTGSAGSGEEDGLARSGKSSPIWRAAPTRLSAPGRAPARSRRWLIIGGIVVAALLAGASAALAGTGSKPSAPAHAARAAAPADSAVPPGGVGQGIPATG
jgi:hypothetical protein